jgi:hypothetical protein
VKERGGVWQGTMGAFRPLASRLLGSCWTLVRILMLLIKASGNLIGLLGRPEVLDIIWF